MEIINIINYEEDRKLIEIFIGRCTAEEGVQIPVIIAEDIAQKNNGLEIVGNVNTQITNSVRKGIVCSHDLEMISRYIQDSDNQTRNIFEYPEESKNLIETLSK